MGIKREIWDRNKLFFTLYLALLLAGLYLVMVQEKGDAVIWMNAHHTHALDGFFGFWTTMGEEWPFILAAVGLLFYQVRQMIFIPLLGLLVTMLSFILKISFAHPRPARYFSDQGIYEQLNKVEFIPIAQGFTSFPSGHTMAAFALFTYLALLVRPAWLKIVFLISAVLVGVSRMYLLQHFLQDVCLGSICGVAIAFLVYLLQNAMSWPGPRWVQPVQAMMVTGKRS